MRRFEASKDEIHETHGSRIEFSRHERSEDDVEKLRVNPMEKKLAQFKQDSLTIDLSEDDLYDHQRDF
jgi:hypothetical protein